MAIPFLNNITLNNNEIQNVRLQNTSSPPLNFGPGQIYFDSTQSPSIIDTAKYYANSTDTWVSLKEYSFPAVAKEDGYITSIITGTTPKPIVKFNLNATGTANNTTYLRGDNQWEPISAIPGTYKFTISDNATPTENTGIVAKDDTVKIAANADLTSLLTGGATASKVLTVGLKVDSGLGNANNYVLNQGTEVAAAGDTIPFNDYTPGATPPSTQTNIVKKTTFGTIPVDALTLVKQYIDDSVAGGLIYQGGFDGLTGYVAGTTNYLDNRGTQIAVNKGWTYTVTVAGTFYGENVEVGDVLIAEDNLSSGTGSLSDWTTVQNNIDLASLTQVGIGNVNAPLVTDLDTLGISVAYAAGTATVGLDIIGLPTYSGSASAPDTASLFIPLHNSDTSDSNEVIAIEQLATIISGSLSKSGTITAGNLSGTVIHDFGINTIVQTINSSGDTVFCDVTRTATTSVATIAVACLLYTSPSPRDGLLSRMPSSA